MLVVIRTTLEQGVTPMRPLRDVWLDVAEIRAVEQVSRRPQPVGARAGAG